MLYVAAASTPYILKIVSFVSSASINFIAYKLHHAYEKETNASELKDPIVFVDDECLNYHCSMYITLCVALKVCASRMICSIPSGQV